VVTELFVPLGEGVAFMGVGGAVRFCGFASSMASKLNGDGVAEGLVDVDACGSLCDAAGAGLADNLELGRPEAGGEVTTPCAGTV
jgi:hypothetical protein